jgi:hypothetical protein
MELAAQSAGQYRPLDRKVHVKRIKVAVVAALVAGSLNLAPVVAMAAPQRHDRHEDDRDRREDRRDRREDRRDRREEHRDRREARRDHREYRRDVRREWRYYDYRRFEPGQRRYDAARYYRRDGYRPYRLGRGDRIYRGYDNRYYCRRDDGTTGLIVGALAGGVLGNVIAPGDSKVLGTIFGAGAGALIGREIDNGVECR